MYGKFVKTGDKLGTSYPETGDAMFDLIDDFYRYQYDAFKKSVGSAGYGVDGYFNSIMGKEITAAMFSSDNAFTCLGGRPYNHEGVRIATEQASYGIVGTGDTDNLSAGEFGGLGASTVQDGNIPESVRMPVGEFREPYKDLPFSFDYGLGLQALENKDDTMAYRDYIDKMSTNYSNLADQSVLRPVWMKQPVKQGVETSLNGISRCISSYAEIGKVENGVTLTGDYVSPYGGFTSAKGDFYSYRSNGETNLDSQLVDINGGTLALDDVRKLWRLCSINWKNSASPNNKVFIMSGIAQEKLAALQTANNINVDNVYVQRDFNGVKTIPGRGDVGMLLNSFLNVPIIQDGNVNFDFTTKKVSVSKFGEIFLLDLDHIWMSMLTPLEMFNINNPAITRMLQERNVVSMRAETRIDSFIQHGKIINIADASA